MGCNCRPPKSGVMNPYNLDTGKNDPNADPTEVSHVVMKTSVFGFPAGSEQYLLGSYVTLLLDQGMADLVT